MAPREPLPDYAPTIRAEIEREVLALKRALETKSYPSDDRPIFAPRAEYVKVGYLANLHHGKTILSEGEMVGGLPMRINRSAPRSISVCADSVRFVEEIEDVDEEDRPRTEERTYRRNLAESTTW